MGIDIKEIEYAPYGKCLRLCNDIVEVVVSIDFGPRILHFSLVSGKNIFYQDAVSSSCVHEEECHELYANPEQQGYRMYGGHRLWLSPQSFADTHYPDNSPVVYGILPDGVSFTAPPQKHSQMQLTFTIMMSPGASDIMIVHSAKNTGKENRNFSLCAISALKEGGIAVIPQNPPVNDFTPNRVFVLWPYSRFTDPRLYWGEKYITIRQDPDVMEEFKLGLDNTLSWAAYIQPDVALIKRYVHDVKAVYPDSGASLETYCNGGYLELSTMSPVYRIEPGETIKHVENLTLFPVNNALHPTDETLLDKFMHHLN